MTVSSAHIEGVMSDGHLFQVQVIDDLESDADAFVDGDPIAMAALFPYLDGILRAMATPTGPYVDVTPTDPSSIVLALQDAGARVTRTWGIAPAPVEVVPIDQVPPVAY